MIKLVIFDLDGTLIDTMEDIGNACNYALQSCGCPARPMTDYNKLVGRGIMNLCKDAIPQEMYSDELISETFLMVPKFSLI